MRIYIDHQGQPGATFTLEPDTHEYIFTRGMTLAETQRLHRLLGEAIRQHQAGIRSWRKDTGMCGAETPHGFCTTYAGHSGNHNFDGNF